MPRTPERLTLADLPNADPARFEEWTRLRRSTGLVPVLGVIVMASAAITIPVIGGGLGWGLPVALWFVYMRAWAIPLAGRERRAAADLGVPMALGQTEAEVTRTEQRRRTLLRAFDLSLATIGMIVCAVYGMSMLSVRQRQEQAHTQARAAGALATTFAVRLAAGGENHVAARVPPSFFEAAGVAPHMGRFFLPDDLAPGSPPVLVLSHDAWQRSFAGDVGVLGRSIDFDGGQATVIAVAPPGFQVPDGVDFWLLAAP